MKTIFSLIFFISCLYPCIAFGDECVEGDCINGKGTMVYQTGHKFSGKFKDGMRHGEGVLLLPGGRKLVGVWQDNEIVQGTFTEPDGTTYTGQWKYREREGRGTLTWPDGKKYVGEFMNGLRHGKGTMTWPDGRQYVGDFEYGERTGQGAMTYPDGRQYIGGFKDGQRHGHGTLVYPDGKKLTGEFKDGEAPEKGSD